MGLEGAGPKQVGRVLVRRVCGLGDLILTIPWLIALRGVHPGWSIHALCSAQHAEFLKDMGILHEAFPEEGSGWHHLFSAQGDGPTCKLRPDPSWYDQIYLFLSDPQAPLALALEKRVGKRVRVLPARPSLSDPVHASLVPFKAMGMEFKKKLSVGLGSHIAERSQECFLVHPGSGSRLKNWPPERFASLMEKISTACPWAHWRIIQGPADQEPVGRLCGLWKGPVEILRTSSLSWLARQIEGSSLFVGNDSGVTHLAAFLGVRTLAIFGPSDPDRWAPLGSRVQVVFRPEHCRPCHQAREQPQCAPPCQRFPSVEEAWERFLYLGLLPGSGP